MEFKKENIKRYFNRMIIHWREREKKAKDEEEEVIASSYIDAYQSARISIFGERLK